ncbi:roadblock/LC7 domain-containing protein [Streptomyces sp. NPDC005336]|uniref:roadblock/LC7 domain-containing protein n=1 Tax=unclassified Streptomyces TaxID=2593676 RepID=UPI0033A433E8
MTRDERNTEAPAGEFDWLLDDLVDRTGHVRQAVLLSSDGLATSASEGMSKEDIDHLAAVSSGFHSLAKGVSDRFEVGAVRQTMVMLDGAYLFVAQAGDSSCLAVLADTETDVGQLAYEMSLLVKRAGRHMASPARSVPEAADG